MEKSREVVMRKQRQDRKHLYPIFSIFSLNKKKRKYFDSLKFCTLKIFKMVVYCIIVFTVPRWSLLNDVKGLFLNTTIHSIISFPSRTLKICIIKQLPNGKPPGGTTSSIRQGESVECLFCLC